MSTLTYVSFIMNNKGIVRLVITLITIIIAQLLVQKYCNANQFISVCVPHVHHKRIGMVASLPGSPVFIFIGMRGEPGNEVMGMACQTIQTEKVKIYVQSPVFA